MKCCRIHLPGAGSIEPRAVECRGKIVMKHAADSDVTCDTGLPDLLYACDVLRRFAKVSRRALTDLSGVQTIVDGARRDVDLLYDSGDAEREWQIGDQTRSCRNCANLFGKPVLLDVDLEVSDGQFHEREVPIPVGGCGPGSAVAD